MSTDLNVILDACHGIEASTEESLRWLKRELVVARGDSAPERFNYPGLIELTEVEAAWKIAGPTLPQHDLLYLAGIGGHPGGGWADRVCGHDLPDGSRLYTCEIDVADVGEQRTSVIALTETPNPEIDARVVELVLSINDPRGMRLALGAVAGEFEHMATVLSRERLVPLLVQALGEVEEGFDFGIEALAEEAPENLEPWSPEWKTWLVQEYFELFL